MPGKGAAAIMRAGAGPGGRGAAMRIGILGGGQDEPARALEA